MPQRQQGEACVRGCRAQAHKTQNLFLHSVRVCQRKRGERREGEREGGGKHFLKERMVY